MAKWKKTDFTGVRYREHPTRKHGIMPDRYFAIRYQSGGVRKEEGRGWASEGVTAKIAALDLRELKEAARKGEDGARLSEKRERKRKADQEALAEKLERERRAVTYSQYFNRHYLPAIQGKKLSTLAREVSLHKHWILPAMGRLPVADICDLHIRNVKRNMEKAGRAPRTIEYAFTCIQMVMSQAKNDSYYLKHNPVKGLKKSDRPKYDNKRTRFFSIEEADKLLSELKNRSKAVHDMTLLSMHCGLRASEIFNLTWGDVDMVHSLVTLRDTKGSDRTVSMTGEVLAMFKSLNKGKSGELVYPSKEGKPRRLMSRTFFRVVVALGLNDGVIDQRQKVFFHTCRHTCASWYVMNGTPLYTVQKILGHSTIAMTERYAHLAPTEFKAAADRLDKSIAESRKRRTVLTIG